MRASAVSQHHSHAPDTAAAYPRATSSRRELVAGVAALTVLLPGAATAAATCDFISSPSGLQYCDIKQGEGPEPVKGALIRSEHHQQSSYDTTWWIAAASHHSPVSRVFQLSRTKGAAILFRQDLTAFEVNQPASTASTACQATVEGGTFTAAHPHRVQVPLHRPLG